MAIAPELRAQILRLYQAERWRVGTIASQLHLHRDTVQRVIAQACVMRPDAPLRPSQIDAYRPFIRDTLAKFPTLAASRLHAMVQGRGYIGGADHFRHIVASHRPRPAAQAYRRLRTLPGEQMQIDWALCRSRHRAQSTCACSPGSVRKRREAWAAGRGRWQATMWRKWSAPPV